jgi:hypothetical protein
MTTATGSLRNHLLRDHIDEWVSSCDKLKIKCQGGPNVQEKLDSWRQAHDGGGSNQTKGSARKTFSNEAFVDAIVEFIIADDQVCLLLSMFPTFFQYDI